MDETATSFDDFFSAMEGESGYQSADTDDAADIADTPDDAGGGEAAEDGAQPTEDGKTEGAADVPGAAGDPPAPAETFALRVNKTDVPATREEMIAYAQKGVDYDRVKTALEQERTANAELQGRVSQTEEVYGLIAELAKESGVEIGELLDQFRVARYKNQGLSDDAARERLGREKAERELASLKGKADAQKSETDARHERAQREVAEFGRRYPDVTLTDEMVAKLRPDVQDGMTLCEAYQKLCNTEQAAEIKRLQDALEAEKQNKANRSASPGSLGDSGAKKTGGQYEDFFSAFNG